jgi:glycerate 2-kinase
VRVLLAPDKFKGTLTAAEVAGHLARGLLSVDPSIEIRTVPVADGGDGLLDAVEACGFTRVGVVASGPDGRPRPSSYAVRGAEAVVEMAEVCGLSLLGGDLAPMTATSRGLGEAIAAALDAGADRVLVGIGGSASTDGGAGVLRGLGARITDAEGAEIPDGGEALARAAGLDLSGLHARLQPGPDRAELRVACDVDNPLTGARGAAAVYGPQKGADPGQVAALDAALTGWADLVSAALGCDLRETPGAGAAGGVGFAALACLGATLRPGAELVQDLTGLDDALDGVDVVLTGEGSLDEQTLSGKAPAGVAAAAGRRGVPVFAVAGRCLLDDDRLAAAGITAAFTLIERADDLDDAMARPGVLLEQIGAEVARRLTRSASTPPAGHAAR